MLEGISVDAQPLHRSGLVAAAVAALFAVLVTACAGAGDSPSGTPLPTPVVLDQVSLPPASDDAPPSDVPDVADIPSVAPPSGEPEAPSVEVDYDLGADDDDAFARAYRSAFDGLDLTDDDVATAGARLCTYLMRHADGTGTVSLDEAIAEADRNQPGFGRETWELAFGIALDHYCGEFSL